MPRRAAAPYPFASSSKPPSSHSPTPTRALLAPSPSRSPAPAPAPSIMPASSATNRPYGAAASASAASSRTHLMPPGGGMGSAASSTASLVPTQGYGSQPRAALSAPPDLKTSKPPSVAPSISDKFSLSPDPSLWGADLSPSHAEPDDYLHNPDPKRDRKNDKGGTLFTSRGIANLGCLFLMAAGLVTLFAGYPLITYFTSLPPSNHGGFNLGGINASGQIPQLIGNFGLIDSDTPASAMTRTGIADGSTYELVWSDEFNTDGRTFYPGDDPYWEAVNLHYWETNNLEWYDPKSVTTVGGALKIWLNKTENHNLNYMGGMVSTWNKFCFTGGYIEASVSLPGSSTVYGLWPAVWTMGNLGRAGYGASLDGMWPYTYDTCDVGTLANQTNSAGGPLAATTTGDPNWGNELSFLPGQKLSACTCAGEAHPGPTRSDGSFVGRAAPEIDILEAQVDQTTLIGYVSQSGQWAPFDAYWMYQNSSSADFEIYDPSITMINTYLGGVYQQATSSVTQTNQACYTAGGGCFSTYGYEYAPGGAADGGYITWVSSGKPAWTLYAQAMGPDSATEIGERPVPQEPMYILANLGLSENFGAIDFAHLEFPVYMLIDYVRVYQKQGSINIGCDPPGFPTGAYINEMLPAYSNPNLTTWAQYTDLYGGDWPKNRLIDQC